MNTEPFQSLYSMVLFIPINILLTPRRSQLEPWKCYTTCRSYAKSNPSPGSATFACQSISGTSTPTSSPRIACTNRTTSEYWRARCSLQSVGCETHKKSSRVIHWWNLQYLTKRCAQIGSSQIMLDVQVEESRTSPPRLHPAGHQGIGTIPGIPWLIHRVCQSAWPLHWLLFTVRLLHLHSSIYPLLYIRLSNVGDIHRSSLEEKI